MMRLACLEQRKQVIALVASNVTPSAPRRNSVPTRASSPYAGGRKRWEIEL